MKKMKEKLHSKRLTINIENVYKNDFNLQKTIAQTKKLRNNNKSLEIRKKKLKELLIEINNEYQLNRTPSRKNLHENNINFHNEYELFNKTTHKKDTKTVFKDLVKLYKSKGYRIPNFSLNDHNLFKINALLEVNTELISNGFLEQQISKKKTNDSDKIVKFLKKLGVILSTKMSKESNLTKDLMKKFDMPKFKIILNDEDSVQELKKSIEILTNLIKTNALAHLDEKRKKKYNSLTRKNSFASINYNSNKRVYYLKTDKNLLSKRSSKNDNFIKKNKEIDFFKERKNSNKSSNSNASISSSKNLKIKNIDNGEKSSKSLFGGGFTFTSLANAAGVNLPKNNFPIINRDYHRKDSNNSVITNNDNIQNKNSVLGLHNKYSNINYTIYHSSKNNNLLNNNNIHSYKSNKNNSNFRLNLEPVKKRHSTRYPIFIKTQSNNDSNSNNYNDFSDELILDLKSPKSPTEGNKNNSSYKDKKKNDSNSYPYSSKNEFINFAFNKFSKKNIDNAENYIKNYLSKVKGYDNDKVDSFFNTIYDKNIKNNIKDLEKQISEKDLYYKTERLYLNSHLIKRIKPMLNTMGERDKMIYRLEKNLTDAVATK